MSARITLTAITGPLKGREFAFTDPVHCTVGRAAECHVQVPGDGDTLMVSRRHCLLDITPPLIRVRDLGSLNGTYVNGAVVGRRKRGTAPGPDPTSPDGADLHDGDRLTVGNSVFLIGIETSCLDAEGCGSRESPNATADAQCDHTCAAAF
jgi:serine/threonine-protein kinase